MNESEASLGELEGLLAENRPYLIVSPPRSCSTALARTLSQNSAIVQYLHEPCDRFFHEKEELSSIMERLKGLRPRTLIKEMTFQFRDTQVAEAFLKHASHPILFLVRNPLLTLESRIRMVLFDLIHKENVSETDKNIIETAISSKNYVAVGDILNENIFPLRVTGWQDLREQILFCQKHKLNHVVLESKEFRSNPEPVLRRLCDHWDWKFEPSMLHWEGDDGLRFGAIPRQSSWYSRVAKSKGILPPSEEFLSPARFPERFQNHLPFALDTFNLIRQSGEILTADCDER